VCPLWVKSIGAPPDCLQDTPHKMIKQFTTRPAALIARRFPPPWLLFWQNSGP